MGTSAGVVRGDAATRSGAYRHHLVGTDICLCEGSAVGTSAGVVRGDAAARSAAECHHLVGSDICL